MIRKVYPGVNWSRKVDAMEEPQVIAVYLSFEKNGMFKKDLKSINKDFHTKREKEKPSEPKQLSIEDIIDEVVYGHL